MDVDIGGEKDGDAKNQTGKDIDRQAKDDHPRPTTRRRCAPRTKYVVGYDHQATIAWRAPRDKPHRKELAFEYPLADGVAQTAPIIAVWKDGFRADFKDVTVEDHFGEGGQEAEPHTHAAARKRPVRAAAVLWEGHAPNGNILKVKQRTDREPLISLFEGGKRQILQICPSRYPEDKDAMVCKKIMEETYAHIASQLRGVEFVNNVWS